MKTPATDTLKKLQRQYLMLRIGEVTLWAFAAACLVYGILMLIPAPATVLVALPLTAVVIVFIIRYRALRLHTLSPTQIVAYINHHYPQLEESTDLLLQDASTLSVLQRIQQARTLEQFDNVYPAIKLPHRLGQAAAIFAGCLAVAITLSAFDLHKPTDSAGHADSNTRAAESTAPLPAEIDAINIIITPPAYTGLGIQKTNNPQLSMPEGSTARWTVSFSDAVQRAQLVFSAGDTLTLTPQGDVYTAQRTFTKSNFYQVRWKGADGGTKTSDYYKIEIIADTPPDVTFNNLQQFTTLTVTDKLSFSVQATLKDDYGLRDAFIVATVAKGSGESVKFREEKLPFTQPTHIQGRLVQASRTIDLVKLGLEPGDELYFYAEAHDGKTPIANRARTETYFVTLKDTTSEEMVVDPGLGVDLMPEYFRSQRQIIIDSEKLLKDRKKISKQEFNSKSNELGYDQKILRLKYGEFLGEEFESGIGIGQGAPTGEADHDHDEKEDVTKKYGHAHDTENEHNLVAEKKGEPEHHHHESADPDKKENPVDAFMHKHDNEEEATFFTQSIRSKLKAALTVMWDAELHLRMYDPEKSLPYQYKALKLLKEISNDSRIYVHKTGFDPPPLKEDKRLSGDLTEIRNSRQNSNLKQDASYPALRQALTVTEALLQQPRPVLTGRTKAALLKGGQALSALALERPGQFLKSLSLIKTLNEENIGGDSLTRALTEIRRALWLALPQEATSPGAQPQTTHALNRTFLHNLEKQNDRNQR